MTHKKQQQLEDEISQLQQELDNLKEKDEKRKASNVKKVSQVSNIARRILLGKRLNRSVFDFINQIDEGKKPDKEVTSELVSSIIRRIVRVGVIGLLVALIPSIISAIQTSTLITQNRYIIRQTNLQENERNSSISPLINDLIKDIETELKNDSTRQLSQELITRIANITFHVKPSYTYFNDKRYLKSKERGFILHSLINYKINKKSFRKILGTATFAHADLSGMKLENLALQDFVWVLHIARAYYSLSIIKTV